MIYKQAFVQELDGIDRLQLWLDAEHYHRQPTISLLYHGSHEEATPAILKIANLRILLKSTLVHSIDPMWLRRLGEVAGALRQVTVVASLRSPNIREVFGRSITAVIYTIEAGKVEHKILRPRVYLPDQDAGFSGHREGWERKTIETAKNIAFALQMTLANGPVGYIDMAMFEKLRERTADQSSHPQITKTSWMFPTT